MIPAPNYTLLHRDIRQRTLIPPERLTACEALVIGVGAIGRQVALQLASVGVARLTLFDDDRVAVENLATQGYWAEDLDTAKAITTAALCRRINPQIDVTPHEERFKRSTANHLPLADPLVVFACVDSIATRRLLWEGLSSRSAFFVDGRMTAEVIRVLAVSRPTMDSTYAQTLFDPSQAYVGACTARSTIYTASIAAGLMLAQFTKWLRGLPLDPDLTLNLLSAELLTSDAVTTHVSQG